MSFKDKTYWLVGASEGLGRELAKALDDVGATLILSARNEKRLLELKKELSGTHQILPLDVSDRAGVKTAQKARGKIDGVIYAAGVYWPLSAENWDEDAVEKMIDINFTGGARILGPVVKEFATADTGHVVVIGSLSGFRGLRGAIGYGASKAGLMHLAETIYADLHRSNVKVQLINPGFIETRLTEKNDFEMPMIMSAKDAAQEVLSAMESKRFQSNFPRRFSWLFRGGNFLPSPWFVKIFGAKRK